MSNWLHRLLNPHCEHCASERREAREVKRDDTVCQSCETLQRQLEIRNHEYDQLLTRLLEKPEVPQATTAPPISLNKPKMISWAVRKQMLEAEDREKAKLMSKMPKPQPVAEDVAELERELDVVADEREAKTDGRV